VLILLIIIIIIIILLIIIIIYARPQYSVNVLCNILRHAPRQRAIALIRSKPAA